MTPLETARTLHGANVATIPVRSNKTPTVKWAKYQTALPSQEDVAEWFSNGAGIAIVAGRVQCLDIDTKNAPDGSKLIGRFLDRCEDWQLGDILSRVIIQRTQSGGLHLVWQCDSPLGNVKLASTKDGKVLLETRGAGGYFLIAPSEGYSLQQGSWSAIPELSEDDRDCLLAAARSLTEEVRESPVPKSSGTNTSPGDDFDRRGDLFTLLEKHGWIRAKPDGSVWTRPGKSVGISATFSREHNKFYVFSTSTQFDAPAAYRPFAVFAILECGGDFSEAARKLAGMGYGDRTPPRRDETTTPRFQRDTDDQSRVATRIELPPICYYDHAITGLAELPAPIIPGFMHRGDKATLISGSKSHKTFCLIQLAVAMVSGGHWLGRELVGGDVLYLNFELHQAFAERRQREITNALKAKHQHRLGMIHLRGHPMNAFVLVEALLRRVASGDFVLLIIDPLYKLLQGLNENASNEMAQLLGELERLVAKTECGLIYADHTPKGDLSGRDHIDLAAGSGVKARDPDALMTLRKHEDWEERNRLYVLEATARNCPPVAPVTVRFHYPLYHLEDQIAPAIQVPRPGRKPKVSDRELIEAIVDTGPDNLISVSEWAEKVGLKRTGLRDRVPALRQRGLIMTIGEGNSARQIITDKGHAFVSKEQD